MLDKRRLAVLLKLEKAGTLPAAVKITLSELRKRAKLSGMTLTAYVAQFEKPKKVEKPKPKKAVSDIDLISKIEKIVSSAIAKAELQSTHTIKEVVKTVEIPVPAVESNSIIDNLHIEPVAQEIRPYTYVFEIIRDDDGQIETVIAQPQEIN